MTLPWEEWSKFLKYPNQKSMLQGLWTKHKSVSKMADELGVEYQVVNYWMKKLEIEHEKGKQGGPNNTGPNYPAVKLAINLPGETVKSMTIREIIDFLGYEYTKPLMHAIQNRLIYHKMRYKPGIMGRPKREVEDGRDNIK